MRARDLAVSVPPVRVDDSVLRVVKLMVNEGLPGVIIVDGENKPQYVVPDSQVLSLMLAQYSDDSALVRTIDEASADKFWSGMGTRSIGDCLKLRLDEARLVKVPADATVLEVASALSKARSALIAVVDDRGKLTGCITLNGLLTAVALPYL